VNPAEFRDGEGVLALDLDPQPVHPGNQSGAKNQGQRGDRRGTDGKTGSRRQGIARRGTHCGDKGHPEIGNVERADETGVHRVVVLQYQQGDRPQQEVGRDRQQGNGEEQGKLVRLKHHGAAHGYRKSSTMTG
jgi:hypothetical protein